MKCRSCSKGCELQVQLMDQQELRVMGGACHRGEAYALNQLEANQRHGERGLYKNHVPVRNGYRSHVLVASDREVPRDRFSEIDDYLKEMVLDAPVEKGQIVFEGLVNLEVKIIVARGMKRRKG